MTRALSMPGGVLYHISNQIVVALCCSFICECDVLTVAVHMFMEYKQDTESSSVMENKVSSVVVCGVKPGTYY